MLFGFISSLFYTEKCLSPGQHSLFMLNFFFVPVIFIKTEWIKIVAKFLSFSQSDSWAIYHFGRKIFFFVVVVGKLVRYSHFEMENESINVRYMRKFEFNATFKTNKSSFSDVFVWVESQIHRTRVWCRLLIYVQNFRANK